MAISTVVAGAYTGSWNSVALNYTQRGFTIHFRQLGQRIEQSDLYGRSLIDIVYQGAQITIETVGMVYGDGLQGPLWPYGSFGTVYAATTPIARLASAIGKPLVLTVVASTPAVGFLNTVTATPAIISPDQDLSIILSSELRTVPLKFDVLLADTAGTGKLLTTT